MLIMSYTHLTKTTIDNASATTIKLEIQLLSSALIIHDRCIINKGFVKLDGYHLLSQLQARN